MEREVAKRVAGWAVLSLATAVLAIPAQARGDFLGESGSAFAALSVLNDDNFYRRDADRQRESRVRLAAGISTALQLGQQELEISGEVHDNRFEKADQLDYVGGTGNLVLNWQVGRRLDGAFEHGYFRDLTTFDRVRPVQELERDITTINESRASVGYFVMPRLQLRVEVASLDLAHSAVAWRASELEETQYGMSIMFRTRPGTFFGIGTRRHDGRYPHRALTPGATADRAYDQVNPAVIVEWHAGGKTSLDARIGHTSREQERLSNRDFEAVTGDLSVEYAMTAKTELALRYSRDIHSIDEAIARAALVDTFEFSPVWYASRNVTLRFHAFYSQQDFLSVIGRGGVDRVDEAFHFEGQVYYNFRGRLDLELDVGRGNRDSTRPDLDYAYWYGNLGVRVTL